MPRVFDDFAWTRRARRCDDFDGGLRHLQTAMLNWRCFGIATVLFVICAATAGAQDWPARPVRLVANAAAGGAIDLVGRIIAEPLTKRLGTPVIVENRGGAGGVIGADYVAKSTPDGYTLLISSSSVVVAQALYKSVPYDVERAFLPISLVATTTTVLAARSGFPANSIAELIRFAKAAPGKFTFGTPGVGTTNHLGGELLKSMTGIDLVHVPFKGIGPAMNALAGGQIDLSFGSSLDLASRIRNGQIKALAVTNAMRSAALPDTPTIGETVSGFDVATWFGLFAPAGASAQIVAKLAGEISRLSSQHDLKSQFEKTGATLIARPPEELARTVREELPKWRRLIQRAGITAEQ